MRWGPVLSFSSQSPTLHTLGGKGVWGRTAVGLRGRAHGKRPNDLPLWTTAANEQREGAGRTAVAKHPTWASGLPKGCVRARGRGRGLGDRPGLDRGEAGD